MTELSCDDDKWKSVAGLVKAFEGQVRIVNPEQAWWVLSDLQPGQQRTSDLLTDNVQFRVARNGEPAAHGLPWLSPEAEVSIERQSVAAVRADSSFEQSHNPVWDLQAVRLAAPLASAEINKEWRLYAKVSSIGQLLLTLGNHFTAADIERYWKSLIIVIEKRPRERGNKRNRTD